MEDPVKALQTRLGVKNRRLLAARLGLSTAYLADVAAGAVKSPTKFLEALNTLGVDPAEVGLTGPPPWPTA